MNGIYRKAIGAFFTGDIDWTADTIKATLTSDEYLPDMKDQFLSAVPQRARVATAELHDLSEEGGSVRAGDVTFPAVSGREIHHVVVYKDTGDEDTSPLICSLDAQVVPAGSDITVNWGGPVFSIDGDIPHSPRRVPLDAAVLDFVRARNPAVAITAASDDDGDYIVVVTGRGAVSDRLRPEDRNWTPVFMRLGLMG